MVDELLDCGLVCSDFAVLAKAFPVKNATKTPLLAMTCRCVTQARKTDRSHRLL
jgi:hypothetical protein